MRLGLSFIPRLLGVDEELTEREDEVVFPAGVVALGRGGAGDLGALLLPDGRLVGLLRLAGAAGRGPDEVYALAAGLPASACQVVTLRRPVDLERRIAGWSVATRGRGRRDEQGALADHFADEYLPELGAAGWSETGTLLALFGDDTAGLRREIEVARRALPPDLGARLATLGELKDLAGDWLAPLAEGQVAIGWWVNGLAGEPPADWPRMLLDNPALRGLPLTLSLHLGPREDDPAPISLADHRQARSGRGLPAPVPDGTTTRSARLLIACTVDPLLARRTRAEVEAALGEFGFALGAIGPARGGELLLACAPLGEATVGRDLTVTADEAAALVPIAAPAGAAPAADLVPLGLYDDGRAVSPPEAAPVLLVGGKEAVRRDAAQSWALARAAAGFAVTVVDTRGDWQAAALAGGGRRIDVAAQAGALLNRLGCDLDPGARAKSAAAREAVDRWATLTAALLDDLCPALTDDDRGDLTATLLGLADEHLAGRGKVSGRKLLRRLTEQGSAAAAALKPLLATSGAPRRVQVDDPAAPPVIVYDAAGREPTAEAPAAGAAGRVTLALCAALERVGALERAGVRGQVIAIDDLAALLAAPSAGVLLPELLRRAARAGAAVWYAASSLAAVPERVHLAADGAPPVAIVLRQEAAAAQATARRFGLPAALLRALERREAGTAVVLHGPHCGLMRLIPDALVTRLSPRAPAGARPARRQPRPLPQPEAVEPAFAAALHAEAGD